MKRYLMLLSLLSLMAACGSNKKDETPDTGISDSAIRPSGNNDTMTEKPDTTSSPAAPEPVAEPRKPVVNEKEKILANIDQYLVSYPDIKTSVLKVENKLPDATIIKAYAEVAVIDASNKTLRTSFLILENIKPGETKSVRIPDASGAVSATSKIVRIKSDELTNGETISVGSRYAPK